MISTKKDRPTNEEIARKIEEEVQASIPIAKEVLENDLFKFNKFVLKVEEGKGKVPLAPFHEELCKFVTLKKNKKKLILIPRGHLKSTLVTVGYTLQQLLKDPTKRVLIANATYDLACSFLTDIKRHLKFNDKIHMIWGDLSGNPEAWSQNKITLRTAKGMHGKKEANVTAMGVESNLTSQHYDLIIMDDVVNKDYVNTADQIRKTIDFYKECLNLLEPNGEAIVIGTRWHDSDLYGWIMDTDNNVIGDFEVVIKKAYEEDQNGEKQYLFPQKFSKRHLAKLREQQGPYVFSCTPEYTPILMSDWSSKFIREVKEGDEVVGFIRGNGVDKNKLVKSKVIKVMSRKDDVYKLVMKSGRRVECTLDHRWYTGRKDKTHKMYAEPKAGKKLMFVSEPYMDISDIVNRELWNYLAGIIDGDGSFKTGGCITITQDKIKNKEVWDNAIKVLNELGIEYGTYDKSPKSQIWLKDSADVIKKLIYNVPFFGKRSQAVKRLYKHSSRFVKEKDKIISMRKVGRQDVYALETTTGNYIAWGYASSNCQYLNDPIPEEDADFKRGWFQYFEFADLHGRPLNKFTMIDPALSIERSADFTAIVTAGIDNHNNIYILDIRRIQAKPDAVIDEIFKVYEQWHPIFMGIEEVAFQKALRYALHQEMNNRNLWLPLKEVKPGNRTKDQRIRGLQPLYANRKIFHNKTVANTDHLEDELLRFSVGKHDDVIDALSYGLDFWYPGKRKIKRRSKNQYLYA